MTLINRFLNLSISHKLFIVFLLFNIVIFLFIFLFFTNQTRHTLIQFIENDLSTKANLVGTHCIAALLFEDKKSAFELMSSLTSASNFVSAAIYDSKDNLFAHIGNKTWIYEKPLEHGFYEKDSYLTAFRDIVLDGERIGRISITIELKDLERIIKRNVIYSGFAALLFLCITLIMLRTIEKFIIRPVIILRDEMKKVPQEMSHALSTDKVYYNDEIGELYRSFKEMLLELQKKQQQQEIYRAEKEKVVQDLHDGLGSIVTNISLLSNLAINRTLNDEARIALNLIKSLAEDALLEIRGFIHSLQEVDYDWLLIAADMKRYGSSFLEPYGILFKMDSSIRDDNVSPPGLRSVNLFRIFKEALSNVVQHSRASKVVVGLEVKPSMVSLYIKDNGVGLTNSSSKRMGLANMQARAREIGGELRISSEDGLAVHLTVPLDKPEMEI